MDREFFDKWLPRINSVYKELQELILTNLVMINEHPAPTFKESGRSKIFCERANAANNLTQCGIDEMGNGVGILPGKEPDKNILVVSHLDTHFAETYDHRVSIQPLSISGVGVADNGLGCAVNAALPVFFEKLDYRPNANIIFMGSSRSLGSGDLAGLQFFLDQGKRQIDCGICLEALELGRISHTSHGVLRGSLTYKSRPERRHNEGTGALYYLTEIINDLLAYPLPSRPKTVISLTSIRAGHAFNRTATEGNLNLEIRSEDSDIIRELSDFISDLADEYSSKTDAEITFQRLSVRMPGGIPYRSELVRSTRTILEWLDVQPQIYPSRSELAALIVRGIPSVTVGLTRGKNTDSSDESVYLDLLEKGICQLLLLLLETDRRSA
ncbi:peptidase [Candidatus Haliotispira prima]|uniref:Peptidase n=1 Tax=Candidatus Haliotispira prima TaxID=3034016 RepID=A0ABY8MJD6_9SPIO|nr:peptidase [Candidatus Haliotispira prima]